MVQTQEWSGRFPIRFWSLKKAQNRHTEIVWDFSLAIHPCPLPYFKECSEDKKTSHSHQHQNARVQISYVPQLSPSRPCYPSGEAAHVGNWWLVAAFEASQNSWLQGKIIKQKLELGKVREISMKMHIKDAI